MRSIHAFFLALLLLLSAVQAVAAKTAEPKTPDPSANPVFAAIEKLGAKFYYLGNRSGLDGWFIIKGGQLQIGYGAPDGKSAVIGAMFGPDGQNITALQVASLVAANKEIADLISNAQKEQQAIAQAGSPPSVAAPAGQNNIPATPLSPGERLMQDLSGAATIVVGNPSAPELLMVMDPHCPHCQATWKALRDSVVNNKIHIRMIPIGSKDTDNERAAAVLLGVKDPFTVWDTYVGGDKGQLVGAPPDNALAAVRANHALIDKWSIQNTPYMVYRGKDGKVKIVQGEPTQIPAMLTDLGGG